MSLFLFVENCLNAAADRINLVARLNILGYDLQLCKKDILTHIDSQFITGWLLKNKNVHFPTKSTKKGMVETQHVFRVPLLS